MKHYTVFSIYLAFLPFLAISSSQAQDIEPTDEEQYMLELINRVRMNPAAEGDWLANHPNRDIQGAYTYFGIDRQQIVNDFASYPSVPPLAFNMKLIEAARRHSKDMKDNNFQGHTGTDGTTPGDRIDQAGYIWYSYGENVYAYGKDVEHAHAGFVVDWGVESLGHRKNTLEYDREPMWKEVGIGILRTGSAKVLATKRLRDSFIAPGIQTTADQVGPVIVTIDFSAPFTYTPQAIGVVYQDLNENLLYDIGEGLGGVTLSVTNSKKTAVTFSSGGFAIPFAAAGTYELTASGGLLEKSIVKKITIGANNIKVDFRSGEDTSIFNWALYE